MSIFSIFRLLITFCIAGNLNFPSGYNLQKEIRFSSSNSKANFVLQLLMDRRINKKIEYEAIPEDARKGIVRFLTMNGIETSRKQLEVPKGDIELLKGNLGGKPFIFVTEDKSIEFGSYNGPSSILYHLDDNNLAPVGVIDVMTGKRGSMELMRSLKSDWKIKENGINGFPEIFGVSCRPDFSKGENEIRFKVTYSHFLFNGTQWIRKEREVAGFWENEGAFPREDLFPRFD